jgi:hypothetical protein
MSDTNVGVDAGADANAQVDQTNDPETKARRLGWVPKEEFRGDPTRWKPADEFVAHGEEILPILKHNNETLHERLGTQERQISEMRQVMVEMRDQTRKNTERMYAQARTDVEEEMKAAVESADVQRFDAAKARLKTMEAPPAYQPNAGQAPYVDPVVMRWVEDNAWFKVDPGMAGYATAVFQQRQTAKPGASVREHLDEVRRDVMERFPDKFGNARRSDASPVAAPGAPPAARRSNKRTFDDLPQDAKVAYARAQDLDA